MKKPFLLYLLVSFISYVCFSQTTGQGSRLNEIFQLTNLKTGLNDPWEITYGPDGYLWITESKGYRVYRMNPNTGDTTAVLDISRNSTFLPLADRPFNLQFNFSAQGNPQGGLAGLALHPDFMSTTTTPKNFVYISYIHTFISNNNPSGVFFTNRLVRFTYNTGTGKLESPVSLCDTLPGSSDHNSQRMIIAPVSGGYYLFYAQGDMGAGQFSNQYRTNNAQNINSYEGKILRFNLEPDGDAGSYDKWIPNNNPYNVTLGKQSAIWATGMRNNQGFAYDTLTGLLYGASHGPYSDDEVNIIEGNKNYGHPLVIGYASDGNYNNSTAGSPNTTSACPLITDEVAAAAAITNYRDPLYSGYAPSQSVVHNIWVNNPSNSTWPSEAWSGMDVYTGNVIPGWKNSLLLACLKGGKTLRLRLNSDGMSVASPGAGPVYNDTIAYFRSQNRFRDLAISPDGKTIFTLIDKSSTTSGPTTGNPIISVCAGCVQKYTFLGYNDNGGKSSISSTIDVTTATANTCNAATTITINATNNNLWVPITGPDGNIMAEIYANGNNLGTVTSSFYQNSGAIRVKNGSRYLDRNITITPQVQPSTPVKIRLYFSKSEFDALDTDPLSGINSINDMMILKNSDTCTASIGSNTTLIIPTYAEAHGANGYMLQASISSFSSFYFGSTSVTLPLELLTFNGKVENNNSVVLKWETTHETGTSSFILERSIDNRTFDLVKSVPASVNNTGISRYAYIDNEVALLPSNIIYYRLKMVNIDGSYTYSNTIVVSLADIAGKVTVFPNPAFTEIKLLITAYTDGAAIWKLTDNTGRVMIQKTIEIKKGKNSETIDINRLSAGTYFINVSGEGISTNLKLQKL